MSTITRIERLAILHAVGDDDSIDPELRTVRRNPDKRRIVHDTDQRPVVPVEALLVAEVERCQERLEAAQLDLRRWRMSHGNDTRPTLTCKP